VREREREREREEESEKERDDSKSIVSLLDILPQKFSSQTQGRILSVMFCS